MKLVTIIPLILITLMIPMYTYAHDHHEVLKGSKPSSNSLYQLKANWVNHNNKVMKLDYFKGKPVIMTMLYTTCKNSCPLIMAHLKFLENELKENKGKVNFVVITLDPSRDKPEVLNKFALKNHSAGQGWYFLNGNLENVSILSALLGIKHKKAPDGEIMHTNKVTVLNKKGEIIFQQENFNTKHDNFIHAVKKSISDS